VLTGYLGVEIQFVVRSACDFHPGVQIQCGYPEYPFDAHGVLDSDDRSVIVVVGVGGYNMFCVCLVET